MQETNKNRKQLLRVCSPYCKLPSLRGKLNSNESLVCHVLPLFEWEKLRDKEDATGHRSFGLLSVARNNSEKVIIKKLLSKDDQEKRLFIQEAKMLHGIKSEHVVKFKAVCISNNKKFLLFNPFRRSVAF